MLGSSRANACAAPSSRSAALSALSNVRSESHRRNGDAMVAVLVLDVCFELSMSTSPELDH